MAWGLGPRASGFWPWALGLEPWALGLGPRALGLGPLALGLWPLSIIGMGVLLRLVYRYFEIGKDDALRKIEVEESANFAA